MKKIILLTFAILFVSVISKAQMVNFSNTETFHDSDFLLTLTPSSADCHIIYTLNGSRPTLQNATLYTEPIHITTTTPVSAACVDAQDSICTIYVHTYIFLQDVYHQSATPAGYPGNWSRKDSKSYYQADYAMDTNVTQSAEYKELMDSAMMSLPTICITTDIDNLFSQSDDPDKGGIYVHTGKDATKLGDGWERPASIEIYNPETGKYIQENCGLLLHGGNSRNPVSYTHLTLPTSLRV